MLIRIPCHYKIVIAVLIVALTSFFGKPVVPFLILLAIFLIASYLYKKSLEFQNKKENV